MDENSNRKHEGQIQKQKETLEMAKALIRRPPDRKPSQPMYSNSHKFVAYPEFVPIQSGAVRSIITVRRLLLLSYISAGAIAAAFLVSKLFLQPLLRRLVKARRGFYGHVFEKLGLLTDNISRQCGIIRPEPNTEGNPEASSKENVSENLTKLANILNSQSNNEETAAHNELSFATENLIVYLNNHVYTSMPFVSYGVGYNSGYGQTSDDLAKNDMVNCVKTEIRSVKGAVLNIRNFPAPVAGFKVA